MESIRSSIKSSSLSRFFHDCFLFLGFGFWFFFTPFSLSAYFSMAHFNILTVYPYILYQNFQFFFILGKYLYIIYGQRWLIFYWDFESCIIAIKKSSRESESPWRCKFGFSPMRESILLLLIPFSTFSWFS